MRPAIGLLIFLVIAVLGLLEGRDYVRRHPQDVPWTELSLTDPIGRFTRRKLTSLGADPGLCRSLLVKAGTRDHPVPQLRANDQCGYVDGMRLRGGGARTLDFAPPRLITSCPVAASLLLLEQRVIQPAAQQHFGMAVTAIDHAGSYSCRRLYGRTTGPFSEHATADAVDIVGFRLADGRRISVLRDWSGTPSERAFLRRVRDGACDLFATVLSPDYNEAHRDHLHLDHARRFSSGWQLCR